MTRHAFVAGITALGTISRRCTLAPHGTTNYGREKTMPKTKTNAPLHILVYPDYRHHEAVLALVALGHTVESSMSDDPGRHWHEYDLILHPAAWRWSDEMWGYLDTAIKEARRARKEQT